MTEHSSPHSAKKTLVGGQNLIARKVLFYILLFSSFVTLLVTSYQLYSDYQEQAGLIEQKMVELEHSYHGSLANAVWFFNVRQIESILAGIIKFEDVHYVTVQLESGAEYSSGIRRENVNLLHYEVDILRNEKKKVIKVGHLRIESNLDGVVQRLSNKFWLILISQAIKTFCVSAFILFIIHYLLTRHLSSISAFASELDIREKNKFLDLNRAESSRFDELDQITQSMNQMKQKLIDDAGKRELAECEVKKLSQAVEQSSASIMILSAEGNIEYVNRKFEHSTGYEKEEVLGIKSDLISFGDDTPEAHQEIWRTISSGKKWRGEQRSTRNNGSLLWETVAISSITGKDRCITNFLVVKDDISELRNAEEELRRAQKMEAIGHLTGGIAHDFNNIIGIIMGNLQLLQSSCSNDTNIQKRVNSALKASHRAAELTARLLQFARKDAGNVSLISLNDFIGNIEDLISKSLTASISVRTNLKEDLWQVEINSGDLEDAILNLSLNARDAMQDSGVLTIKTENKIIDDTYIKSHPECRKGEFVMLSICDTGTGMSDQVKEQALHPFFTTKEQGKGTGLGLSMVYAFIKRSNGHINIASEFGKGTSVQVLLPRAQVESTQPKKTEQNKINSPCGNGTVLVVDDEEALCELACVHLESMGFNTLSASNAKQAIEIMGSEKKSICYLAISLCLVGLMGISWPQKLRRVCLR